MNSLRGTLTLLDAVRNGSKNDVFDVLSCSTCYDDNELHEALYELMETNNLDMLEYLLATGYVNFKKLNRLPKYSASLLAYGIEYNKVNVKILKAILNTGKSEPGYYDPETKQTALHNAAMHCNIPGRIEIAKLLLLTGESNPRLQDYDGKTALDYAEEKGCTELINAIRKYM